MPTYCQLDPEKKKYTKMHLEISSANWRPFCPGRYELMIFECEVIVRYLREIASMYISNTTLGFVSRVSKYTLQFSECQKIVS